MAQSFKLKDLIEASYKCVSLAGCHLGDRQGETYDDLFFMASDGYIDSRFSGCAYIKLDLDEEYFHSAELALDYQGYDDWLFVMSLYCEFDEEPHDLINSILSFFDRLKEEKRYQESNEEEYTSGVKEFVITNGLLRLGLVISTNCQYHTITVYVEQVYDSEMSKEEASEIYRSLSHAFKNDEEIEKISPDM